MIPPGFNHLKPSKVVVPVAVGLAWGDDGRRYEEKMDGQFAARQIGGAVLLGELLKRTSRGHPPGFYAFDLVTYNGQDVRGLPLRERLGALADVCAQPDARHVLRPPSGPDGGKLLAEVLRRGGEGVICKDLDSALGAPMLAAKRLETWLCVVTGFCGGTQSVLISRKIGTFNAQHSTPNNELGTAAECVPAGKVALRGGKCDRVRVGSVLKVEGMELTASGMIREPRLCRDSAMSWLVKF